jgi:hypothetical protein
MMIHGLAYFKFSAEVIHVKIFKFKTIFVSD